MTTNAEGHIIWYDIITFCRVKLTRSCSLLSCCKPICSPFRNVYWSSIVYSHLYTLYRSSMNRVHLHVISDDFHLKVSFQLQLFSHVLPARASTESGSLHIDSPGTRTMWRLPRRTAISCDLGSMRSQWLHATDTAFWCLVHVNLILRIMVAIQQRRAWFAVIVIDSQVEPGVMRFFCIHIFDSSLPCPSF
jgi:hypothetical protein